MPAAGEDKSNANPNNIFLLSKAQNHMFLLSLYLEKTIKNHQNFLAKDLKDQFIGMNIKQKVRIKIRQINKGISSNLVLLELIDYLFQFIKIKMPVLKHLKLLDIIYQKALKNL